ALPVHRLWRLPVVERDGLGDAARRDAPLRRGAGGMSWVRIDDHFPDHPKIAMLGSLGPVAGWLHVAALCYCARYLTDGFIPAGQVMRLADFGPRVRATDLAERLVAVGLWDHRDGGYSIHDYLE